MSTVTATAEGEGAGAVTPSTESAPTQEGT